MVTPLVDRPSGPSSVYLVHKTRPLIQVETLSISKNSGSRNFLSMETTCQLEPAVFVYER
jgi:hypothetical protein